MPGEVDLEHQKDITNNRMDEIKQKAEKKKEEEPKGASAEGEKLPESPKEENPEDKKPEEKPKTEEPKINENKVEKRKEEIQKDIDALIAQKKSLGSEIGNIKELNDEIKRLENLVVELSDKVNEGDRKEKAKSDQQAKVDAINQREQDRIKKYLNEDKEKPFSQRREMSDEDEEEFSLQSPKEHARWAARQELRRDHERQEDENSLKQPEKKNPLDTLSSKTKQGLKNLLNKFPDLATAGSEQNKRLIEIVKEHPDWRDKEDGPDLVLAEMNKSSENKPKTYTEEEVKRMTEEAVAKEKERLSHAGVSSTIPRTQLDVTKSLGITEAELKLWRRVKPKWSDEQIAKRLKEIKARRASIPGARIYDEAKLEEEEITA